MIFNKTCSLPNDDFQNIFLESVLQNLIKKMSLISGYLEVARKQIYITETPRKSSSKCSVQFVQIVFQNCTKNEVFH